MPEGKPDRSIYRPENDYNAAIKKKLSSLFSGSSEPKPKAETKPSPTPNKETLGKRIGYPGS